MTPSLISGTGTLTAKDRELPAFTGSLISQWDVRYGGPGAAQPIGVETGAILRLPDRPQTRLSVVLGSLSARFQGGVLSCRIPIRVNSHPT